MNRTDRLLAIVLHIQSKGKVRAEDLAAFFETSKRTIYRDIGALSEAGVPIIATPGQGYSLSEGYFLPPLSFSADEALMLLLGGGFAAHNFDAHYRAAAESALLKIESVLPERVRADVREIQQSVLFVPNAASDLSALRLLRGAIVERRSIRFGYHARTTNAESEREADPHALAYNEGAWYLLAYDHGRDGVRNFRLDRMADVRLLPKTFVRRYAATPAAHDPMRGRDCVVRILFDHQIARWVRESANFYATHYEDTADGLCVTLRVYAERDIVGWVLSWGSQARVLEPDELRAAIAAEAAAIVRNAQS